MSIRARLAGILGRAMERILGDPQPMGLEDWGNSGARTTKHTPVLRYPGRAYPLCQCDWCRTGHPGP